MFARELLLGGDYNKVISSGLNTATSLQYVNNFDDMICVDNIVYAVNYHGKVYSSNDSISYSEFYGNNLETRFACLCQDFTQENGTVIAFTGDNVYHQPVKVNLRTTLLDINQLVNATVKQCIYVNGNYYLVGYKYGANYFENGYLVISNDLYNWSDPILFDDYINTIAYGNNIFIAAGRYVYTSSDGINYQKVSNNTFKKIIYTNGYFIAIDGSNAYKSQNGVSWEQIYHSTGILYDVAYGNNKLVICGTTEIITTIDYKVFNVLNKGGSTGDTSLVCYGNNKFSFLYQKYQGWYSNYMTWGIE